MDAIQHAGPEGQELAGAIAGSGFAILHATSTKSLLVAPRNESVARQDDDGPDLFVQADPTGDYGVAVSRYRFNKGGFLSGQSKDHVVVFHDSAPVEVNFRLRGRRIVHTPHPSSLNIYLCGADSAIEVGAPTERVLFRVSTECLALAASQLARPGSILVEQVGTYDDVLYRLGQTLEAEVKAGYPNGMMFWSSAADAFIRHLTAHYLSSPSAQPRGSVSRHAIRRLGDYIHDNLAESLDLSSLAAVVGCDRFHFAHRFRSTVGMSPHRYVMRVRLERARERIKTGASSLAEVAFETGFTDHSHLCRWIRRVYNLRPKDLRG